MARRQPADASLEDLRRDYQSPELRRRELAADPLSQFRCWLDQASGAGVPDANAMTLATVGVDGQPSTRIVLLKDCDSDGLVFYTNLESRKAIELGHNPRVALLFFWPELHRQVRVEGTASLLAASEAAGYFGRRPRDSRLAAWASPQSAVIESRESLEERYAEMQQRFADAEIPLPEFWGGYRVEPAVLEFWQGRASRLHDRFRYTRSPGGEWRIDRLAP